MRLAFRTRLLIVVIIVTLNVLSVLCYFGLKELSEIKTEAILRGYAKIERGQFLWIK